jgi:transcriptional regulator with XRE-family HTH domain
LTRYVLSGIFPVVGSIEAIWSFRVKSERKARNWRQADLAKRSGYTQQQVSAWENGAPIPDTAKVALAQAFGVRVGDLFSWPDEVNGGEAA